MTEERITTEDQGVREERSADLTAGADETAAGRRAADCGTETRLSAQQMTLLTALVINPDMPLAYEAAGVSRATAYRWIKEPTFQEELTRRRDEVLTEALATSKIHAARAMARWAGLLEMATSGAAGRRATT